jgi:type VI secretion system FHA domain protein
MSGTRHAVTGGGASIGRGGTNTLVLPDPSRITSSSHATITEQNGAYTLLDHSSNGTFLNTTDQPLEKGIPCPLNKGDTIFIGPYRIEVDFEDTADPAEDLGGSFLESLGDTGKSPAAGAEPASAVITQGEDDLDKWLSPHEQSAAPKEDWALQMPPADSIPEPALPPLLNDDECADPLALLDGVGSSAPPGDPLQAIPAADDSQWWLEPQPDNAPPMQQAMSTPRPLTDHAKITPIAAEPPVASANPPANTAAARQLAQLMGLKSLSEEQLEQLLPAVGSTLVLALARLMEVLRARSSIKNEIKAVRTIIGAAENNPLKFAAQVEDALNYMFSGESRAFMRADTAINDSFNDLEDHQLATLAGMRAAYERMLSQFNPQYLMDEMGVDATGRLVGNKKAKAWDAFCKHYDRLSADPEAAYNRLFGDEFGRVYEDQVSKLKGIRRQGKQ